MKIPFKKEVTSYKSEEPQTPYQRAKQEWDNRIGDARLQARNWRLLAICSIILALLLLVWQFVFLASKQDRIFVAEVAQSGRVINVAPLTTRYQPTEAQIEYFLAHFVELVRGVPLDPVVAKKNWLTAYKFLSQRGAKILDGFLRENNPLTLLGKKTVTTKITDINPISNSSYQLNWTEITVNLNGQVESQKTFSGTFTISLKSPASQEEILTNPLGIFLVDLHINPRETLNEKKS